ncbi:hypothetical protein [Streptomyces sp. NPDC002078]
MVELDIVLPTTDGGVEPVRAPALLLPVHHALPLLTRARALRQGHRSTRFWGAVCHLALHFLARGVLLPGLSPRAGRTVIRRRHWRRHGSAPIRRR